MHIQKRKLRLVSIATMVGCALLAGCAGQNGLVKSDGEKKAAVVYPKSERTCLQRAIFFEANRSSRAGMIAVGTVVMNRVNSSAYPNTICAVVGQKRQFAPGVLTRKMNIKAMPDVAEAADAVLRGERDPKLKNAMFFHTAGLKFPYKNMHYVQVAGGNAFYEKRARDGSLQVPVNDKPYDVALAYAQENASDLPQYDMFKTTLDKSDTSSSHMARDNGQKSHRQKQAFIQVEGGVPVPLIVEANNDKPMQAEIAAISPDKLAAIGAMLLAQKADNR